MLNYEVNLGTETIDLEKVMSFFIPVNDKCGSTDPGSDMRSEMRYVLGNAGYKWVVDTLQQRVDQLRVMPIKDYVIGDYPSL